MSNSNLQNALRDFVSREVIYCVSSLFYELIQKAEHFPDEQDDLYALAQREDWQEPAEEEGWEEVDGRFVFINDYTDEIAILPDEDWEQLCAMSGITPEDQEDPDYVAAAIDSGWELHQDATFVNPEAKETSYAEHWQDLCNEQWIDPYTREVFEHYVVSGWLGDKLKAHGEIVVEIFNMTIWGRCCTGQAIMLDGVIEEIYRELYPEKFADGKLVEA